MANSTQENVNFTRFSRILIELGGQALRDVLTSSVTITGPINLPQKAPVNADQLIIVNNIHICGNYDECDVSLLYLLIRNLCGNVLKPTKKWGHPVNATDITVGDDIERIRCLRNALFGHIIATKINNSDYNIYMQELKDVFARFDHCHGGVYNSYGLSGSYVSEMGKLSVCPLDPGMEQKYKKQLILLKKQEEDLEEKIELVDSRLKKEIKELQYEQKVIDEKEHELQERIDIFEEEYISVAVIQEDMKEKVGILEEGYEEMKEMIDGHDKLSERVGKLEDRMHQPSQNIDTSKCLKEHYERLEKDEIFDKFASVGKDRFFVELCIVDGNIFRSSYQKSDMLHHKQQQLKQKESITLENLCKNLSTYTIIRGVTGIGKSHIASEIAYRWSTEHILKDITYLFLIRCREINGFTCPSILDVLNDLFPEVPLPSNISTKKCCFILDGLDEYEGLNNIIKCHRLRNKKELALGSFTAIPPIDHTIYSLLKPRQRIFPNSKIIITGRPECCSSLEELYSNNKVTHVDVLGFSEKMAEKYIDNFFNDDESKKEEIKKKLKANNRIQLMSRIPIYLNIICCLYHKHSDIVLGETELELYLWQLAFLLQKHLRQQDNEISDLTSIPTIGVFNTSLVDRVIKPLAQIVFNMQVTHKFIFDEEDINDTLTSFDFDNSGLIMKVKTSNGIRFQFFHLTMSELLSATYLFINQNVDVTNKLIDSNWHVIISFLCGLQGGLLVNSASPKIVKHFAKSLGIDAISRVLISDMLCKYAKREIDGNLFKLFMASYFAYQNKLCNVSSSTSIECWIIDSSFSSDDFKNFCYFLKNEPGINFNNLKVEHLPLTQDQMEEFVKSLASCQSLEIKETCCNLEPFMYEFHKFYGDDVNGSVRDIPFIKAVEIDNYKRNDLIDWLFLTDILNVSIMINDCFDFDFAVKILSNVNLQLIRIKKTIENLDILLSNSTSDNLIIGKSAQIERFKIHITETCETKEDVLRFIEDVESQDCEVLDFYWKDLSGKVFVKSEILFGESSDSGIDEDPYLTMGGDDILRQLSCKDYDSYDILPCNKDKQSSCDENDDCFDDIESGYEPLPLIHEKNTNDNEDLYEDINGNESGDDDVGYERLPLELNVTECVGDPVSFYGESSDDSDDYENSSVAMLAQSQRKSYTLSNRPLPPIPAERKAISISKTSVITEDTETSYEDVNTDDEHQEMHNGIDIELKDDSRTLKVRLRNRKKGKGCGTCGKCVLL